MEAGAIPCRVLSSLDTGLKQGLEPPGLPALFASQLGGECDLHPASSLFPEHHLPVAPVVSLQAQDKSLPSLCLLGGRGRGGGRQGRIGHCRKPFCPQVTPCPHPSAPGEGWPLPESSSCWKDCSGQLVPPPNLHRPGNGDADRRRALSIDIAAQSRVSTNHENSHH